MLKDKAPKPLLRIRAPLVFPKKEDGQPIPDLTRRPSDAARSAYSCPRTSRAPGDAEDLGLFPPGERPGGPVGPAERRGKGLVEAGPYGGPSLSGDGAHGGS